MSRQEVEALQILYDDIKQTFSNLWPGCTVEAFGSVVTGLALRDSDVDCFLRSCEDEPARCVERCREFIDNGSSPFSHASVVMKKVPIVQFFHAKTGRHCDVSFNRPIAVEFGKLVSYLLSLDGRALKLAVLIKCWAKIQKVTGKKRLPSNALIILIIFFLQHKKILPSVAMLQQDTSPRTIDGWNTAFTEIQYKYTNAQSVYNLLGEFFMYYVEFDFRNLIVCPYLGYPVERCQFRNTDSVPSDFQLYIKKLNEGLCEMILLNRIICIQDPFDHARNCAGPVKSKLAGEIVHLFRRTASVYANTSKFKVLNTLLSYKYRESDILIPEHSERWNHPPRREPANGPRVGQRGISRRRKRRAPDDSF